MVTATRGAAFVLLGLGSPPSGFAQGPETNWPAALVTMPFPAPVLALDLTNGAPALLHSFGSNDTVKALLILPGATDHLYFVRHSAVALTNVHPTLLDAVNALTSHTPIRATFRPPFLMLGTASDLVEPHIDVQNAAAAQVLHQRAYLAHVVHLDQSWDRLRRGLTSTASLRFLPRRSSPEADHFYRVYLAGWNLTDWEAVQALGLTLKAKVTVAKRQVTFRLDQASLAGERN